MDELAKRSSLWAIFMILTALLFRHSQPFLSSTQYTCNGEPFNQREYASSSPLGGDIHPYRCSCN